MLMRVIARAGLVAGLLVAAYGLYGAETLKSGDDRPPVSKPTPTVEEGMPLFSFEEVSQLFQATELPEEKKEHPIFVGQEDDIVEMETFQVYSDNLTLRQSLEERMSEQGWKTMMARIERLDPKTSDIIDYEKRSGDRFFSGQTPGGAADRPDPGGIDAMDAYEAVVEAVKKVYKP